MIWFVKNSQLPIDQQAKRSTQLKQISNYSRFILLRVTRCGCKSAIQQMDQVYPINHPPALPFPGCDQEQCGCVYEGIVDRRSGKSRRLRLDRRVAMRPECDNRRRNHGRRKGDRLVSYGHM